MFPNRYSWSDLEGLEDRSPFELSGGQQQRLAIASALAMEPKIVVMDEPTSNVDPIGKEEIFSVAEKLNRERNMTVIMAEHEVEVIAAYAKPCCGDGKRADCFEWYSTGSF